MCLHKIIGQYNIVKELDLTKGKTIGLRLPEINKMKKYPEYLLIKSDIDQLVEKNKDSKFFR